MQFFGYVVLFTPYFNPNQFATYCGCGVMHCGMHESMCAVV